MERVTKWLKGSIYRALLLALIVVSVVPIILISILFTRNSMDALTRQTEANLLLLAQSKAEEINLKLQDVAHTTVIASYQAASELGEETPQDAVTSSLTRYAYDHRGILGLDVYYEEAGGMDVLGESLSNVYWTSDIDPAHPVAQKIVQTESLDAVFSGVKSVSPDTQWIYMTTPEGMMRLYPWATNDHYPDNWDPREIVFYTVAEPKVNPDLGPEWTAPYVDYAGAGWMVTVSVPIMSSSGEFLGIMSHDITIQSLKEIALGINVLDGAGYGFLIDESSGVIAHPDYQDADASKGTQEEAKLLAVGLPDYRGLIGRMVDGESGYGYYDAGGEDNLMVYAPVPETGWSLGIAVPRSEVVAPAMEMRNRAIGMALALIGTAVLLAIFLSRRIHDPLKRLLQAVHQVTEDEKADEMQLDSFVELNNLARAFNEMASIVWERERKLKDKVAELRIEIDTQRKNKRLNDIVETDFFQRLETNAARLRADVKGLAPTD